MKLNLNVRKEKRPMNQIGNFKMSRLQNYH